jgi:hypothetical protein
MSANASLLGSILNAGPMLLDAAKLDDPALSALPRRPNPESAPDTDGVPPPAAPLQNGAPPAAAANADTPPAAPGAGPSSRRTAK